MAAAAAASPAKKLPEGGTADTDPAVRLELTIEDLASDARLKKIGFDAGNSFWTLLETIVKPKPPIPTDPIKLSAELVLHVAWLQFVINENDRAGGIIGFVGASDHAAGESFGGPVDAPPGSTADPELSSSLDRTLNVKIFFQNREGICFHGLTTPLNWRYLNKLVFPQSKKGMDVDFLQCSEFKFVGADFSMMSDSFWKELIATVRSKPIKCISFKECDLAKMSQRGFENLVQAVGDVSKADDFELRFDQANIDGIGRHSTLIPAFLSLLTCVPRRGTIVIANEDLSSCDWHWFNLQDRHAGDERTITILPTIELHDVSIGEWPTAYLETFRDRIFPPESSSVAGKNIRTLVVPDATPEIKATLTKGRKNIQYATDGAFLQVSGRRPGESAPDTVKPSFWERTKKFVKIFTATFMRSALFSTIGTFTILGTKLAKKSAKGFAIAIGADDSDVVRPLLRRDTELVRTESFAGGGGAASDDEAAPPPPAAEAATAGFGGGSSDDLLPGEPGMDFSGDGRSSTSGSEDDAQQLRDPRGAVVVEVDDEEMPSEPGADSGDGADISEGSSLGPTPRGITAVRQAEAEIERRKLAATRRLGRDGPGPLAAAVARGRERQASLGAGDFEAARRAAFNAYKLRSGWESGGSADSVAERFVAGDRRRGRSASFGPADAMAAQARAAVFPQGLAGFRHGSSPAGAGLWSTAGGRISPTARSGGSSPLAYSGGSRSPLDRRKVLGSSGGALGSRTTASTGALFGSPASQRRDRRSVSSDFGDHTVASSGGYDWTRRKGSGHSDRRSARSGSAGRLPRLPDTIRSLGSALAEDDDDRRSVTSISSRGSSSTGRRTPGAKTPTGGAFRRGSGRAGQLPSVRRSSKGSLGGAGAGAGGRGDGVATPAMERAGHAMASRRGRRGSLSMSQLPMLAAAQAATRQQQAQGSAGGGGASRSGPITTPQARRGAVDYEGGGIGGGPAHDRTVSSTISSSRSFLERFSRGRRRRDSAGTSAADMLRSSRGRLEGVRAGRR